MASQVKAKPLLEGEKRIQKYTFSMNHLLGKGSFASVFLGRQITDNSPAAVKVIEKKIFANQYNLKNIHYQIEIMKKLQHENIVKLLDVYQTSNNMYIVTEFCEEGDLRGYLKKKKRLSQSEALNFLKDIMKGFEYLNKLDIVHRDLKPANILINNGQLKISDFGFARNLDNGDSTVLKSIVGTPLYMSPQILSHQTYTNKSDLWSVGLIYYELLHGYTPWPANSQMQLLNSIHTRPVCFDPSISEKSKDFIRRCLKKKEEERMTWDEAFSHPLLSDGLGQNVLRDREEKDNRTPRRLLQEFRDREKNRSKSRSVSATKANKHISRTPVRSRLVIRNQDMTPDKKSPWKL